METLTFSEVYHYDTRKTGITVDVNIQYGGQDLNTDAKVDTGASYCIFRRKEGEHLGIDIESGDEIRFGTAMGSFIAYGHEVALVVLGIETFSTVCFAADESFSRNVLGRQGWLDRVKLGLVDYEGKLYLSPYNESD
jgi:predicted aspartyl protease